MNLLTLESVSKSYGEKVLFSNINLHISRGDKAALVASNGSGKSTLLRVIAGEESGEGEHCRIEIARDVRIGYLRQEPAFDEALSVIETIFSATGPMVNAVREYETALLHPADQHRLQAAMERMDNLAAWDFEVRAKDILSRLSITDLEQSVATLSGGQRKRLALARLLIEEPEFLILDEPTNHLDLEMIEWLETFLVQQSLSLFIVTHDRYFLDRVCNYIVELDDGQLHKYKGNYSDYLIRKTEREEHAVVVKDKARKLMKQELEWIRRMPKARGTKAKSRIDAFGAIRDQASVDVDKKQVQLDIRGERLGSKILELQYISKSYGGQTLFKDLHYSFKRNERVGIVGKNGSGKTTLLNIMTGALRPDSGKVVMGSTVKIGHYSQSGIRLGNDKRVIDVVRDIAEYIPMSKGQKLSASQLLELFLFTPSQQQVYVSKLSGGERRRLYLLTVLMSNPNFLILDEPTNDLDILTLNVLEAFLLEFPGCVVIVSHDRFFMDKVVDHLFVLHGDGKVKDFNGNYSEYRDAYPDGWSSERTRAGNAGFGADQVPSTGSSSGGDQLTYEERKELKRLENSIKALEREKTDISGKFDDPDLTVDDIEQYSKRIAELNEQIELKEERWLYLADKA